MSTKKNMEIEKKFLISTLPSYPWNRIPRKTIKQAYIANSPVLRIRQIDSSYKLTVKGKGLVIREEFEMDISAEEFHFLKSKTEGNIIEKTRYYIPYNEHIIEFDVFEGFLAPLMLAEVEFTSIESCTTFVPPLWFEKEVSNDPRYANVHLSTLSSSADLL